MGAVSALGLGPAAVAAPAFASGHAADMRNDPFLARPGSGSPMHKIGVAGGIASGVRPTSPAEVVFLPWLMFVLISLAFLVLYQEFASFVWLFVCACVFASGACCYFFWVGRGDKAGAVFLGILCLLAVITASVWGFSDYISLVSPQMEYEGRRYYTNVRPLEPSASHQDAGMIEFDRGASLQVHNSVGYSDGDLFCVAPVAATGQTTVGYWAAGVNCCSSRGDFRCDAAGLTTARSGLVLLDGSEGMSQFRVAAREAAAVYGLTVAQDPVFVRWVPNPVTLHDSMSSMARGAFVAKCILYFMFSGSADVAWRFGRAKV